MLNVWKYFFIGKIFGKTCLSSKSPSGNVESRSDNSHDSFPPKVRFYHRILKKLSQPPPPFWNCYQTEHFSRKFLFLEKFIWTDKDTILTICFQISKNICRMSRKSLEDIDSTKKKTVYPNKIPQIWRIQFRQSCWTFSKIVRIFAPKFYGNKVLDFRNSLSNCL